MIGLIFGFNTHPFKRWIAFSPENWDFFRGRNKIVEPSMTKADEKESEVNQELTNETDKVEKI